MNPVTVVNGTGTSAITVVHESGLIILTTEKTSLITKETRQQVMVYRTDGATLLRDALDEAIKAAKEF